MDDLKNNEEGADRLARLMRYVSLDPQNSSLVVEALTVGTKLNDWHAVAELLEKVESFAEKTPTLCALAGYAYLCLGNFVRSSDLLGEALAGGIEADDVAYNLAYSLFMQHRFDESLETLSGLNPTYATGYSSSLLRARLLLADGQYDNAVDLLNSINTSDLMTAESLGLLAIAAYEESENTQKVMELANQALSLDPQNHEGLVARSAVLMDVGDFIVAEAVLRSIVEHHPKSGRGWLGLSQLEFGRMNFDKALEAAHEAVKYNSKHIGSLHLLGWCHLMKGDISSAYGAFIKAYELDRNFGESHAALASIYTMQDEIEKARKHLKLAEKLNKDSFGAVFTRMLLLEKEKNPEAAAKVFNDFQTRSYPILGGATPAQMAKRHIERVKQSQIVKH